MGRVEVEEGIELSYEEFGSGNKVILSAQVGFYPKGVQQELAKMGYHVYCITLRGFYPSSYVMTDYKDAWYDVFADDVVRVADALGIDRFVYTGASHGSGVGWHLLLRHPERVQAFVAMVPGPHSLAAGAMSYRQMLMQGIISSPPPMDPPITTDAARKKRRAIREEHISHNREPHPLEKAIEYGRPLMRLQNEENLCEALKTIQTPTLILGGVDDPISTPELMVRTAHCLPHCKLVMYSECGHNIDTDLVEELAGEADRFLRRALTDGTWYDKVVE